VKRSLAVVLGVFVAVMTAVMTGAAQQAPQGAAQQPAAGAPPAQGRGAAPGRGRGGPAPRIAQFEARPSSIKPGESAMLVWLIENPAAPGIEPGIGRVTPRGTVRVTPAATTTYTLTTGEITRSVTVTVAGTQPVAATTAAATNTRAGIPRTAEGKPDFSGVYGFGGGGGGRGRGAAGGAAPAGPQLKPGAEKYRVQRGPQDTGRTSDCMPLPPPDAFGVPYEFQIVQNKDHLVIMHEYPGTFRIIPLDGEPHQIDPDPAWLGDSVGKWEGDTLVIDTIGYNDKTEIAGYRHSDALHTVERLRRVDGGVDYEITIEDPNVFVAPFTQMRSFRLTAAPMKRIMEFICENNRDYRPLFGTQAPAK
jgi:hypothetical protein